MTDAVVNLSSSKRQCGGCTLCCKLLPVRALGKPADQRCQHQRSGKGCAVYAKLWGLSPECKLWNCRWLGNDDMGDMPRPDRAGYVVDIMPDFVKARDDATGEVKKVQVVQVWADRPDVHRDPALRRWLDRKRMPAVIRSPGDGSDAKVIAPPSFTGDGWFDAKSEKIAVEDGHSTEEIIEALSQ